MISLGFAKNVLDVPPAGIGRLSWAPGCILKGLVGRRLVVGDGYLRFALWDSGRVWRLSQGFCDPESSGQEPKGYRPGTHFANNRNIQRFSGISASRVDRIMDRGSAKVKHAHVPQLLEETLRECH